MTIDPLDDAGVLPDEPDVAIIGAGPAGLLLAVGLAARGRSVLVLERREHLGPPPGAAAGPGGAPGLQPVTLGLLDSAGVLDAIRDVSAPITRAEVLDGTRLVASSDYADVVGAPLPYSMSVPVAALSRALYDRVATEPRVRILTGAVTELVPGPGGFGVSVTVGGGRFVVRPRHVVACDGKHSVTREAAGIGAEVYSFPGGYLETPLPLPADRAGVLRAHLSGREYLLTTPVAGNELLLVWITSVDRADAALAGGQAAVVRALADRLPDLAPWITEHGPRSTTRTVPHHVVRPDRWSSHNLVLVGDSAHGLHALGGQGLNTSLQDALCTAVTLGDEAALGQFHDVRRPFIEAFQDMQLGRVGGHGGAVPDLDVLALAQPEVRALLAEAVGELERIRVR